MKKWVFIVFVVLAVSPMVSQSTPIPNPGLKIEGAAPLQLPNIENNVINDDHLPLESAPSAKTQICYHLRIVKPKMMDKGILQKIPDHLYHIDPQFIIPAPPACRY